ncbi:MAG: hypothetical protein WCV70_01090 [Patescibacteria group bacterium]
MKKRVRGEKLMADHVALGIDNWSRDVRDDLERLNDRKQVPIGERLFCTIDGTAVASFGEVVSGCSNISFCQLQDCLTGNEEKVCTICGYEFAEERKIGGAYPCQPINEDDYEDRLDTPEKIKAYYRFMYPWLFIDKAPAVKKRKKIKLEKIGCPKFHGATRQSHPKPKVLRLHSKSNAKRRPCKCRCRKTIRQIE